MRRWQLAAALSCGALLIFLFQTRDGDPGGNDPVAELQLQPPVRPAATRRLPPSADRSGGDGASSSRPALRRYSESEEVTLEIRVTDRAHGRPVESAEVRVSDPVLDFASEQLTDFSGRATSHLKAGEYRIEIRKPGFLPEVLNLGLPSMAAGVSRQVELTKGAVLEGSVVNQHGEAVAGARIAASRLQPGAHRQARRRVPAPLQSRDDGSFLTLVEPGTYSLEALKRPHAPGRISLLTLGPGPNPPVQLQVRELDQVVEFSGKVVDKFTRPVARARIRVRSGKQRETTLNSATTDDAGDFRMQVRPVAQAYVDVSASGFRSQSRVVRLLQGTSVRFRLKGYQLFSVRVLDGSGRAIEGIRVYGESMQRRRQVVRAAGDGRFYSQQYPFWVYADAFRRGQGLTEIILVESYQPEIQLLIEAGGELRGRVTDAAGLPVTQFTLSLQFPERNALYRRVHSEDGSFLFRDLWPGPVSVLVTAPSLQRAERQLSLQAGEMEWIDLSLPPQPQPLARPEGDRSFGGKKKGTE